ncbi:hypothetical protein [Lacimicrobium alkaliphilum]|uniref:Uncharacterized protein n=1 Tax=Lacimicrobium alkaliphilum TaxID=1526571 RepID=A0ABQ1RCZ7_9ALTE|nr:hypothetical protein [Lacimicrobium alkaliphilum]GGD62757.1 hypothetical protein GCM10011357_17560 [Lacimicrobium alkaliphilum]
MKYIELIGISLKSDILLDLFETYDVDVVYRYDRNHEGMDDEFTAEIPDMGLEFLFNSSQELTTLFMRNVKHSGFNPFDDPDPRRVPFNTGIEAMEWAKEQSIDAQYQESKTDPLFGEIPEWVKLNFETFFIHYQFENGSVTMVTLQAQNA